MARLDATVRGIAVMDRMWLPTRLHTADTSVEEADPRPGTMVTSADYARTVPQIVGAQSQNVNLIVTESGYPGPNPPFITTRVSENSWSGEVAYYLETVADTRSWQMPTRVVDWRSPDIDQNDPYECCDAVMFPLSGKVAVRWWSDLNGRDGFAVWNPYTDAFENEGETPIGTAGGVGPNLRYGGSLAVVPGTERLLLLAPTGSWYTDDYGANWHVLSTVGPASVQVGSPVYEGKIRSAFDSQGNLRWMADDTSSAFFHTYVSSDMGVSWSVLAQLGNIADFDMAQNPDGSITLAIISTTLSNELQVARLESAWEDGPSASFVAVVDAATQDFERCALAVDHNGVMWAYGQIPDPGIPSEPASWFVYASGNGTVWDLQTNTFWSLGDADTGPAAWRIVPHANGGLIAACTFGTLADPRGQAGICQLGSWSAPGLYATFGDSPISGDITAAHWMGFGEPDGIAGSPWSYIGVAAVDRGTTAPLGDIRILSGVGADAGVYHASIRTGVGTTTATAELACSTPEDGGGDLGIGFQLNVQSSSGAGTKYLFSVRVQEDGFRIRDDNAAAFAAAKVLFDCTERVHFRVEFAAGAVILRYRADGTTAWLETTATVTSVPTASDTSSLEFGQIFGVAGAISRWWYAQGSAGVAAGVLKEGTDSTGVTAGADLGYPIPDLHNTTAERMAKLLLRNGPAIKGEIYSHDINPGYPIEAVFPSIEPSPSRRWRSTTLATQDFVVDRGYDGSSNGDHSILWLVHGTNARRWTISAQVDGGAGVYTDLGTIDLAVGFTDLSFTRQGEICIPATGTAGARYVRDGELAGGHIVMDPLGTPVARRIRTNLAGWWDANATGPRMILILEDVDTTTDPTTGDCNIVWPSGVMVIHGDGNLTQYARYWRARCLTTSVSPETYREAGIVAPFGLKAPGKQWGNGWEWSHNPNQRATKDSFGTERRSERGPIARTLSLTWDHGEKMERTRGQTDADYVGAVGKAALAARDEVWQRLLSCWKESNGGTLPVVALLTDPGHCVTMTDPTLWMYAYLDGSLRSQHATGAENVKEFMRTGPVRLEEIV